MLNWTIFFLSFMMVQSLSYNRCNWTGKSTMKKKFVTSVYLECTSGRIEWTNSHVGGALIIVLKAPFQEKDFDACFKLSTNNSRFSFVQNKALIPLYFPGKHNYKSIRCFSAQSTDQLMIYVESFNDQSNTINNSTIIDYDLEAKSKRRNDECKPCSDDELSRMYCDSDVVVRGKIKKLENYADSDDTQIMIQTSNFFRKNVDISNDCDTTTYDINLNGNEIFNPVASEYINKDAYLYKTANGQQPDAEQNNRLTVLVPKSCGVIYNDASEYVFMLKKKLNNFRLVCAPRLQDWIQFSYRLDMVNGTSCKLSN